MLRRRNYTTGRIIPAPTTTIFFISTSDVPKNLPIKCCHIFNFADVTIVGVNVKSTATLSCLHIQKRSSSFRYICEIRCLQHKITLGTCSSLTQSTSSFFVFTVANRSSHKQCRITVNKTQKLVNSILDVMLSLQTFCKAVTAIVGSDRTR